MDGTKILSMFVGNLHFLDSLISLPMNLTSMSKSFDLTCKEGYTSFFYTVANLDYVGPYPEPKFNGADHVSGNEQPK